MVHFVNQPQSRSALLGQALGKGAGVGLSEVADSILNQKINQLAKAHERKQFMQDINESGMFKEYPEIPKLLQVLEPKERSKFLTQWIAGADALGANNIQQPQATGAEMFAPGQQVVQKPQTPGQRLSRGEEVLNPQLGIARERLKQSERKATAAEKLAEQKLETGVRKETAPIYTKINDEAKAAKESDIRLNQMEKLIEKGKLPHPGVAAFLDTLSHGIAGFGINLKSLLGADAEQFEKLSSEFVKTAKPYFGNRLTDTDLKFFMSTVPSLSQSNEGKKRLIDGMKLFNEAAVARQKAMNQIIKDNGGKRPVDLDILIDERIAPELDSIADKFKKIEYEKVPETRGAVSTIAHALPGGSLFDFSENLTPSKLYAALKEKFGASEAKKMMQENR